MKNPIGFRGSALLALSLFLLWQGPMPSFAAKKYYPPGFTPPSDQKQAPSSPSEPPTQVIIQQVPGAKQVIIKTVPVKVTQPAKPRDPLLVLLDEHRYYDASRIVNERLKKSPNNLSLQMLRGQILRDQGSYSAAVSQYEDILVKNRSKGTKAGALNGLGWTYYEKALHERRMGDLAGFEASLSQSDSSFRQATLLSPGLAYAWAGLGEVALANGQVKEAAPLIKKAKRLAPGSLAIRLAEAELLLAEKKPEDALQQLYGIKKTTTHEPKVFLLLAKGSLDTGKVDDAIINLKQLLDIVPDDSEALKLLSQTYEMKMKPEDAAETLEKAIAINPNDSNSVEALIKIYDQRKQTDRSILLLKTLLKDKPGQVLYGRMLMERLLAEEKWTDAYEQGHAILSPTLSNGTENEADQQRIVSLFAQSVFQQERGLLDRRQMLKDPVIQQASQFARKSLQKSVDAGEAANGYDVENRLNLLMLDPLASIPALPDAFSPTDEQLAAALQIAFLQGNQPLQTKLYRQAEVNKTNKLNLAYALYWIGDYAAASRLAANVAVTEPAQAVEANQLKARIAQDQATLEEHLASLSMLPRKISSTYWQKAATEALRVGNGNWETHATLARGLEKRHQGQLALIHQRLAARYAENPRDKEYWQRKADKNARSLGGNVN